MGEIYMMGGDLSNVFFNFFIATIRLAVAVFTRRTRKRLARIAQDFGL